MSSQRNDECSRLSAGQTIYRARYSPCGLLTVSSISVPSVTAKWYRSTAANGEPSTTVVSRRENRGYEVGNGRNGPKLDGSVAKETMQCDKELKEAWNSRYNRRVFESQEY